MNEKSNRKKFIKEFKHGAIKLITEQGYSRSEAGRRLGVHPSVVSRWVREYHRGQKEIAEGGIPRRELEAEIKRLCKENKWLEMKCEILKKTAPVFAKESD